MDALTQYQASSNRSGVTADSVSGTESLRRHLDGAPARIHDLVNADVRRAARLIESGLGSFATVPEIPRSR